MGFNSASLFPARKREKFTHGGNHWDRPHDAEDNPGNRYCQRLGRQVRVYIVVDYCLFQTLCQLLLWLLFMPCIPVLQLCVCLFCLLFYKYSLLFYFFVYLFLILFNFYFNLILIFCLINFIYSLLLCRS